MDANNGQSCNCWKFILLFIGYILVIAAPTAVMVIRFPDYTPWILVPAFYLIFAGPSWMAGWEWDDPRAPEEGWRQARHFPRVIFVLIIWGIIWEVIRERDGRSIPLLAVFTAFLTAAIYPPFFLGRAVKRRRDAHQVTTANR